MPKCENMHLKVYVKNTGSYYGNAYYTKTFRPNYLNFGLSKHIFLPKVLANFGRLKVKICENMAKNSTHFEKKNRFFLWFFTWIKIIARNKGSQNLSAQLFFIFE